MKGTSRSSNVKSNKIKIQYVNNLTLRLSKSVKCQSINVATSKFSTNSKKRNLNKSLIEMLMLDRLKKWVYLETDPKASSIIHLIWLLRLNRGKLQVKCVTRVKKQKSRKNVKLFLIESNKKRRKNCKKSNKKDLF